MPSTTTFQPIPGVYAARPSPLRARRLLRGLRLRDVEFATGLTAALVGALERGEFWPSPNAFAALARFYETPVARLAEEMTRWTVTETQRAERFRDALRSLADAPSRDTVSPRGGERGKPR
jgi:transcriptional regulator with XRE-family HTH domain